MSFRTFAFAFAFASLAGAQEAGQILNVDGAQSSITYHMVHKMHKFDGISRKVEGKVRLLPSGQAQVMVRAPVQSFDSGNANRDAHMKEVVEAARYPFVELKAAADGIVWPNTPSSNGFYERVSFPSTTSKVFKAQLTFHGVQQTLDLPVEIVFESANRARATAHLAVSLDAYKVERPSLMFIKVDDSMKIDVKVALTK